jgi:hypothetical protein
MFSAIHLFQILSRFIGRLIKVKKQKIKLSRYGHAGANGERIFGSYSFLTSALDMSE